MTRQLRHHPGTAWRGLVTRLALEVHRPVSAWPNDRSGAARSGLPVSDQGAQLSFDALPLKGGPALRLG